jgi:hypothetical protein
MSRFAAARRLEMALALWFDLPQTYRLLVAGEISDYVASLVVTETRHLDAATRRDVDGKIVAAGIAQMGPRRAATCAPGMPMRQIDTAICSPAAPNAGIAG